MKLSTIASIVVTTVVLGSTLSAQGPRKEVEVPQEKDASFRGTCRAGPVNLSGGAHQGLDPTSWTFWWEFNKAPILYLDPYEPRPDPVEEGFFLGHARFLPWGILHPSWSDVFERIVPALHQALATESNAEVVTGCLMSLAKIGDPEGEDDHSPLVAVLAQYLAHENQEVSEVAVVALGTLKHRDGIEILASLLRGDAEGRELVGRSKVGMRVRAFAGYGLGLIGAAASDESVRQSVVGTLMSTLRESVDGEVDIETACAIALGLVPVENLDPQAGILREDQIDLLLAIIGDASRSSFVRAHATTSLARLLDRLPPDWSDPVKRRVVEGLLERIGSRAGLAAAGHEAVARSAAQALGIIGDGDDDVLDRAIRANLLAVAQEGGDPLTRCFALLSLARVSSRAGDEGEAPRAEKTLLPVAEALRTFLTDDDPRFRPWAALALGHFEGALFGARIPSPTRGPSLAALRGIVESGTDEPHVDACALGLALAKDTDGIEGVQRAYERALTSEQRGYLALALGLLGARGAFDPLDRTVRKCKYRPMELIQIGIALALLEDGEAAPVLITELASAQNLPNQAALSCALGFLGDRRAVDPLVKMLGNMDIAPGVRGFVAAALGLMADNEVLPWETRMGLDLNYFDAPSTLNSMDGTGILNSF